MAKQVNLDELKTQAIFMLTKDEQLGKLMLDACDEIFGWRVASDDAARQKTEQAF